MGKMYILVEADKSQGDPLASMMTQLVEQLKVNRGDSHVAHHHSSTDNDKLFPLNIVPDCPPKTSKCDALVPAHHHHDSKQHSPCDDHHHDSKHHRSSSDDHHHEVVQILECQPTSKNEKSHTGGFRSITAEASFDAQGHAKAKVSVTTNQEKKKEGEKNHVMSIEPCKAKKCEEHKNEYSTCGKRNGLDPTPAELKGQRCFKYLPLSNKIPEYKCKLKTVNVRSDHSGGFGRHSGCTMGNEYYKLECPKNIPAARVQKYNACIARRNGLQDKCDGLSKSTLKSCCKKKKEY